MPEIGVRLQEARMRAGLEIAQVESATKIRAKYLRAIEEEAWDVLPGPTFVKTFLRTYADHLGLDSKLLVDEYRLRHEPPPDDVHSLAPAALTSQPRARIRVPYIPRGWAIAMSVAALLVALTILGSIGDDEPAPIPRPADTVPTQAAPPPPTTSAPTPTRVTLTLKPTQDVYVCLRDAAGELVVDETLAVQSGSRTFTGDRFRLTVGRATIDVRVNGERLRIPEASEPVTYELKPGVRRRLPGVNACE